VYFPTAAIEPSQRPDPVTEPEPSRITLVLDRIGQGEKQASRDLLPLVYDELRRLARARLGRENPGQTLQPTALVHEAFLRVTGGTDPGWDGRSHFFGAAALAMRRILVEQARRKAMMRRAGAEQRVEVDLAVEPPTDRLLQMDEALKRLEQNDPRKGRIVNLRYFAGLTTEETADVLGVSTSTVEREWRFSRSWLQRELSEDEGS
jgi:RNA polymerase sigma factor (TIGR02999 family)